MGPGAFAVDWANVAIRSEARARCTSGNLATWPIAECDNFGETDEAVRSRGAILADVPSGGKESPVPHDVQPTSRKFYNEPECTQLRNRMPTPTVRIAPC